MHSLHEFVNFLYGIQAVVVSFASSASLRIRRGWSWS